MLFFEKNKIDLDVGAQVSITITDAVATDKGQDFVDYLRNRSNDNGWGTTGSSDAALTQIDIQFGEEHDISAIFFIGQNWKTYTCQYASGAGALTDFSTPINVVGNTEVDRYHAAQQVAADRLRIIIAGTMVADADKFCAQIIVTDLIGRLTTIEPQLNGFDVGKNRRKVRFLSGKYRVQRNLGSVGFRMRKDNVTDDTDLALLELLHDYRNGLLVWPNGDANTFLSPSIAARINARQGWRRKDLYLMAISSELSGDFDRGRYENGINHDIDWVEVI